MSNTAKDVRRWLQTLAPAELPVFEATSGCDGHFLRQSADLQKPVRRVNPLHSWHFAQSLNLPKTDRADARMLARLGAERQLTPSLPYDAERAELSELNGRRDQLKRMETQEKNRLSKAISRDIRNDITDNLCALARRIKRIENKIDAFLTAHPSSAKAVQLLETIPGIGRVSSITLLSHMPELGQCDRRAIASLGGLAPKARESGKWRGHRSIGGGRRHVRKVLYMAALTTLRHGSFCSAMVRKMRAAGKAGKVIAIALARKLLTIANAVLRDEMPFQRQIE